jgi:hypothetical protein
MSTIPPLTLTDAVRPAVDLGPGPAAVAPTGDAARRGPRRDGRRRSLLDLFMEEVDALDDLPPDDRDRIKARVRRRFSPPASRFEPPRPPPAPGEHPIETLVRAIAPHDDATEGPEADEDRRLALQFRRCLEQHTERALRVSAYVHALQASLEKRHRPTVVVVT